MVCDVMILLANYYCLLGEVGVGYYFPYDAIIRCTGFEVCSNGGLT